MAKTTKKAPKRATTTKKKGFLGRSFNLRSRKVQFMVFILIVAILGGGYYTYKSFAASQSWPYTIASHNLIAAPKGSCQTSYYEEPQKNKMLVWSIACPADRAGNSAQVNTLYSALPAGWGGTYRFCAYVKGVASSLSVAYSYGYPTTDFVVSSGAPDLNSFSTIGTNKTPYKNFNSSSYQYLCSPTFVLNNNMNYRMRGTVTTSGDLGKSWINVASITLEKL